MVYNEEGKKIHFGDLRYFDYTKHKNKKGREQFRNRNKKWKDAENIVLHTYRIICYGN